MRIEIVAFLGLVLAANALHLHQNHNDATIDLPPGNIALRADNGGYINVCHECGEAAYPDSAAIINTLQNWTLEVDGDQVAFKANTSNYLTRCNSCWSDEAYQDSAFVHASDHNIYSLWTPVLHPNGKYSFRSDNGNYLARCDSCARGTPYANFAFVHDPNPDDSWVQWDVIYTDLPQIGVNYTFQADNGYYMKSCTSCETPNAVSVTENIDDNAIWNFTRVGTKVAIQGANGKFLSRCNHCWSFEYYDDSAFVNQDDHSSPSSLWTPTKLPNGKWIFQADSGKYLARCGWCTNSSTPFLAFVHITDPQEPWAQWTLA